MPKKPAAAPTIGSPQKNTRSEQSRINGANSKGPKTASGKLAASRSALKHGLTATIHTVLNHESPELCQEIENAWIDDLRPATKAELRLIQQLSNINWRLERLGMMETSLLNIEMAVHFKQAQSTLDPIDDIGLLAAAWKASADSSSGLDLLRRYLATLQNQFSATLKNYRALEASRKNPKNIRDFEYAPPYQKPVFNTPNPNEPEPTLEPIEKEQQTPLSGYPRESSAPENA